MKLFTHEQSWKTFKVKAGLTKLSCPLVVGGGMRAKMKRGGLVVADCHPVFKFEGKPTVYNYNAFVAMSESG